MKPPAPASILIAVIFCLAAAGCTGPDSGQDSHADSIKDMVMNRYDGLAQSGGECGEK